MVDHRAGPGRRGLQGRNAGRHHDGQTVPGGAVLAVHQFEDQGGQGIDPGVSRTDQGDRAAFGGQIEGKAGPGFLGPHRADMAGLAGNDVQEIEIEAIADQIGGLGDGPAGLRGSPGGLAGSDPDDAKAPLRLAQAGGVDVPGGFGDGAGGARADFCFGKTRWPSGPTAARAGSFGDAVAADFGEDRVGRGGETGGFGFQAAGGEKSGPGRPMRRPRRGSPLHRP